MRRALLKLVAFGLSLLLAVLAAALWWLHHPMALHTPTVELSVELGQSPREVARAWVEAGVDGSSWGLYQWFRVSGQARQIRAGNYELSAPVTPRSLLAKLVAGDETLSRVRLGEGWTFRQVREELNRTPGLKQDSAGLSDAQLMAALGRPGQMPEGRFFPDTYAFAKGSSDLALLERAHRAMAHRLDTAWSQRVSGLPLATADEALALASIVEKETGRAADRAQVAGVFVNRLRLGMPLQTDPTIIYGLGTEFDGDLRRRDLLRDGPYNTYTRTGLPPTPIAMPGRDALMAVLRPARTNALYFVSRGDGSSEFSETLADHNRAVNRYQRGRTP
ncbi:MAG: endolytic transglycosylase MltG [Burkholderiales bacterium]